MPGGFGRLWIRWPQQAALDSIEKAQQGGAQTAREFLDVLELHVNHLPVLVASGALSHELLGDHLKGGSLVQAAHGDLSHLQLVNRLAK